MAMACFSLRNAEPQRYVRLANCEGVFGLMRDMILGMDLWRAG